MAHFIIQGLLILLSCTYVIQASETDETTATISDVGSTLKDIGNSPSAQMLMNTALNIDKEAQFASLVKQFCENPTGAIGTTFGAVVGTAVPEDVNRSACEHFGFIDNKYKTGNTTNTDTGFWGTLRSLAGAVLPNAAIKSACVHMGWYHPARDTRK